MIKTRLTKRIIPLILFQDFQVVKSIQYSKFRVVGNFEQTIEVFNIRDVDEIIILDIEASSQKKNVDLEVLKILSKNANMPFSYGGGVKNLSDIEKTLKAGADKVVINNIALNKINFISEASKRFGSQCIVVAIDYITKDSNHLIYSHVNKTQLKKNIINYIKEVENAGAGEIILSSVDNDGLMNGFEKSLIQSIPKLKIPIVLSGGCGEPAHIEDAFKYNIDGIASGSMFYYSKYSYDDIKTYLSKIKANVRI